MPHTIQKNEHTLVDHIYQHLLEEEWTQALELFDKQRVKSVTNYHHLVCAKIHDFSGNIYETRFKLRPNTSSILWLECTCKKNRLSSQFCPHIAALALYIERKKQQTLKANPLQGAPRFSATILAKKVQHTTPKQLNASQSLLSHLKQSIINLRFCKKSKKFIVSLDAKPGDQNKQSLTIDAFGSFIASQQSLPTLFQKKKMTLIGQNVPIGSYI